MMDANATLEQREHHGDLRKLLIFSRECLYSVFVNLLHAISFFILVEVAVLQTHGIGFTFTFGEAENNAGVEAFGYNKCHELTHFLTLRLLLLFICSFLFLFFQ